ncbi:uncharacterized protein WCC33_007598 isoform 2-T2 [Rhinophrynus dorsalis]
MAGNKLCHKPDLFTVGVVLVITILCIIGTTFISIGASYLGSIWVFRHHTSYHGQCHDVLFLFAFWTLIVQYIGLSIAFLASVIYCCFFCIMLWACVAVNG